MSRRWLLGLIILPLLMMLSCSDDDDQPTTPVGIKGSGVIVSESRTVDTFNSVELNTVATVMISQGITTVCSLSVDDNVLQYIETPVVNGTLGINSRQGVSLQDFDLTVHLTMVDLEELKIKSVGTITGTNMFAADDVGLTIDGVGTININLDVDRLTTSGSGVGNFALSGSSGKHNSNLFGSLSITGYDTDCDTACIVLNGPGNAEVTVLDSLDATINSSGSIYYKGDPVVKETINGTGQVIDAN